jgi:hypothetical protein
MGFSLDFNGRLSRKPLGGAMRQTPFDRRPGLTPPAPPVKKGPRFSYLAPPKSRFFDVRMSAFLLASGWLIFYMTDRVYFQGVSYAALTDAIRTLRASLGF